jgi:glucose/arabinose dehydrogenase
MHHPTLTLLAFTLWLPLQPATAASFDCAKARTPTEKHICANETLSRLDEQLDDAYRAAQRRAESRTAQMAVDAKGCPDNKLHAHRHPIASFIFDTYGALLVNVGAPSDQCLSPAGKPTAPTCPESEQGEQTASIRRYAPAGPGNWSQQYTVHARGLRNSVALARHASGTVLQGENSYDFEARLRPFEEINVIEAGRHYGWPYCYDNQTPSPGWKDLPVAKCADKRFTAPTLLLPPHSSPLSMRWYDGVMFPKLKGKLLVTWHGFRSVGGRIAAFETDARGIPVRIAGAKFPVYGGAPLPYGSPNAAEAFILTPEWNKVVGVRPQGSPVGLAIAKDGAIWTTDDRAGLVIRIATDAEQ